MSVKNNSDLTRVKVLIISYDFFPEGKPNTYRWFNIAKKWQNEGAEVFVISANKNQFSSFEEVEGVKIYRTTEYFIGNLKYKYRNVAQAHEKTNSFSLSSFFKKALRFIYDYTWSKLYWPDYSFLWCFSTIPLASKIIKEHKIEKLITVSWFFSAHLIGYNLKKKYKSVFWLADTIDTFSINGNINNLFLYKKLNHFYEKKVFLKADVNTVLTDRIKDKYISIFPEAVNKIEVINNIFIPVEFDYNKIDINNTNVIKFVFLGTLVENVRSPKLLLKFFDSLIKKNPNFLFELNFYGEYSNCLKHFYDYPHLLNKSIFLKGFIDRDKVNDVIKNTDLLLNIGNVNEYQEPSKLIEYMYSGKKILNISSIDADTSAVLLRNYPLAYNVFPDEIDNDKILDKVFDFIIKEEKQINRETLNIILNDYFLDTISEKYFNLITSDKV